jgi:N-acetylneuraminic acid mutarotase
MRHPGLALLVLLSACGGDAPENSSTSNSGEGNSWASLPPMNVARQEVGVAEIGGRIYVAGGFAAGGATVATLEAFDTAAGTWTMLAPMPIALNHPAAAAVGGRLYVIGGSPPSGVSSATLEYDPQRNSWATRAPMPTARSAPMAGVIGNRIYVAGGTGSGRELEAYDPAADSWTRLAAMPTARNHVAGGAIAGRLFVVGGRPPNTLANLEAYDVAANAWTPLAAMPTGRSGHAAAVVRGCLYVFGGEGNPSRPDGVFPQNEVYNPRSNTWESLLAMPTPRHGIGAAAVGDRIYIPGGASVQGFGVVSAHEVYTVPRGKACE